MLQVQVIFEILGRPAENVKEALVSLIARLEKEAGITVREKTFHAPVLAQGTKDLYTAFVEVTVEIASLEHYFDMLFAYMPSHVELIYPERLTLDNNALNQFAGKLLNRMHGYDSVVKNMLVERDIILAKVKEKAPHLLQELSAPLQKKMPAVVKHKKKKKARRR